MTHPPDIVEQALALARSGRHATEIARQIGIPRRTIVDWLHGRAPQFPEDSPPAASDLPDAYVYLLGLYLGDGCVSTHARGVSRLRITLDAKYPGIVAECEAAIATVMPANQVHRRLTVDNCYEVSSYSKRWPILFPQAGPGKKHLRLIEFEDWQHEVVARVPQLLLRGLIHSDGCRFINIGRRWSHPRYSFSNRSADIHKIFCDACDLLDVRWTVAPHTVYVSRKADVALLDRVIGPKT